MMNKTLAAAALAASANALKLDKPTTTLAQAAGNECHHTYTYQCIEEKVMAAHDSLTGEVADIKADCLKQAGDAAEQSLEDIQALRYDLETNLLGDLRETLTNQLNDRLDEVIAAVEEAAATANANMRSEANQRINGDSEIDAIRKRAEADIKKLYYRDGNGAENAEDLKAAIRAVLDEFDAALEDPALAGPFDGFAAAEINAAKEKIAAECAAFDGEVQDALDSWNDAAENALADFDAEIAQQTQNLNDLIAEHQATMADRVAELIEDYIVEFWNTIEDIYSNVSFVERQGIIWRALYLKQQFVDAINALMQMQTDGLNQIRTDFIADLAAERAGFSDNINENRDGLFADTQAMKADAKENKAIANDSMAAAEEEAVAQLEDAGKNDQAAALEDFVYDLASIGYSPKGFGSGHADGYQPYGRWVANRIEELIADFGVDAAAAFQNALTDASGSVDSVLNTQITEKRGDNAAAQAQLNTTLDRLLSELSNERNTIEAGLQAWQDFQQNRDEEAKEVDKIALVSTKNQLWKDLSWIVRKTLSQGGHEHGLSAGPVYSYNPGFLAQTTANGAGSSVSFDTDFSEPVGFGAEGPEDGYDPYGYGDFGWGYGYQQQQYKEVSEKLQAMKDAQALIIEQNEARLEASQAELDGEQAAAWDRWTAFRDARWADFQAAVDAQDAAWAQNIADRTAAINEALSNAGNGVAEALRVKLDEFDRMEKEIRWHITSIYNYDVQHELNEALTAARAAQDAICEARQAAFGASQDDVRASWDECVDAETASLEANTAAATAALEAAKEAETEGLAAFKAAQQQSFSDWADAQRGDIEAHVAACEEAWEWIQVSYCLKHSEEHNGRCSWGAGAGIGNAGYLKGVAIEEHADVLDYGQGDIPDIKHIQNEQDLVDKAAAWTMQGVEEEMQRLTDELAEQGDGEAEVIAAKQALRDALDARLADSIASLDATVARLGQELADAEDEAIAGVQEQRAEWEDAIDALRASLLWDIKELVWKLGYAQGYAYGAHDGHDAELLAMITAKKDEYEEAIKQTLRDMATRVADEQDAGDARNAAAWDVLEAEFDRLTAELAAAITARQQECRDILAAAAAARGSAFDAATEAFNAFIAARRAAWAAQEARERNNATWQEDSYYRHQLLRLLNAKNEAIEAAIAQAEADWAAAVADGRAEGAAFRDAQADSFYDFTDATAAALRDAIKQDRADMQAEVDERVRSLDERLDAEQTALEDAMEADRAEMKRRLKEVYNYNTYEFTPDTPIGGHISAPYSHEQHRAFLSKFAYYMKDELAERDGANASDKAFYDGQIAQKVAAAVELNEDAQRAVTDDAEKSWKRDERAADTLLEDYASYNADLLAQLQEQRAIDEAAAGTRAEEEKLNIIYAMHILRYAGGRDSGSFGFGDYASSYYGKGNSLTGVDTLDNYRLPNAHDYAQVAEVGAPILKLNDSPDNRTRQEDALKAAKQAFDDMVAECRAQFGDRVAADQADSDEFRAQAILGSLQYATDYSEENLVALIARQEENMAAANQERKDWLSGEADARVAAMQAAVDEEKEKTNAWFADQIEWANKLYDSYYKEHLLATLEAKRDANLGALDDRVATAEAQRDAANEELWALLDAEQAALEAHNAATLAAFEADADNLNADSAAAAGDMFDQFVADTEAENAAKNATMDQLVMDWAYWMKYLWGYAGYDTALYANYDDTRDYSQGRGDGFGVGGIGGVDYLHSDDHHGLAYNPFWVGPNPKYFGDSILEPKENLTELMHGYSKSYAGLQYW